MSDRWRFVHRESKYERRGVALYLYPDLGLSGSLDGFADELSGRLQVEYYVERVRLTKPSWWELDAVPIYWMVQDASGHGTIETAPFQPEFAESNFLTYFTWPDDPTTGKRLDWFRLPILNSRFPKFAEALGWTPSPFQRTCPLRSLMNSRNGRIE